jgi:hypothetical protein
MHVLGLRWFTSLGCSNKNKQINNIQTQINIFILQYLIRYSLARLGLQWNRRQVAYRGVDKSLARPGKKQATATEDSEFHVSNL